MRISIAGLRALLLVGAVVLLADSAGAASWREKAEQRRDESYAQQMVQWMRRNRREPTERDLRSNRHLRDLWSAYQRVRARQRQQKRDRASDRQRYLEWKRKNLEERAKGEHQRAQRLLAARRYREAIEKFKGILNNGGYAAYHDDSRAKLQDIDQIGQDEINQAKQQAAAQDYEKAIDRYRSVIGRFHGLPCGEAALTELKALNDNPEVQTKLKKDRAVNILKRAEGAYTLKDYAAAVSLYEMLTEGYADLEEGQTAKTKLDTIKADKKIWEAVVKQRAEREARSLLALANSYVIMGKSDKAVPRLKELIQKYPASEHAKKARALLAECEAAKPAP